MDLAHGTASVPGASVTPGSVTPSPSKGASISRPYPGEADASRLTAEQIAAAVLFREILKPLANGLGPVGEVALGAVADDLFVRRPR